MVIKISEIEKIARNIGDAYDKKVCINEEIPPSDHAHSKPFSIDISRRVVAEGVYFPQITASYVFAELAFLPGPCYGSWYDEKKTEIFLKIRDLAFQSTRKTQGESTANVSRHHRYTNDYYFTDPYGTMSPEDIGSLVDTIESESAFLPSFDIRMENVGRVVVKYKSRRSRPSVKLHLWEDRYGAPPDAGAVKYLTDIAEKLGKK